VYIREYNLVTHPQNSPLACSPHWTIRELTAPPVVLFLGEFLRIVRAKMTFVTDFVVKMYGSGEEFKLKVVIL